MTRKDFILIAETVKVLSPEVRKPVAHVFAERLAKTHAHFDREKFLDFTLDRPKVRASA